MKKISDLFRDRKNLGDFEKKILSNSIIALIIKIASLGVSLAILPAYINYFSNDNVLGFWLTILAFFSWLLTFDLGIGNGLRQKLVSSIARDDQKEIKTLISSTYILTSVLFIVIIISFIFVAFFINWNKVFNVSTEMISRTTLQEIIMVIFFSVMFNFLLRIINSILHALQKSGIVNLTSLVTNLFILIAIYVYNPNDIEQQLKFLAYFYMIALNVPLIIMTIIIFIGPMKKYVPSFKNYNNTLAKSVLSIGLTFFVIQIMYLLINGTNEYLISFFTKSSNIVDFQIYSKLFIMISTFFTIALIPIWSAVTRKHEEKDYLWIKKISKYSLYFAIIFIILELIVLLTLPKLLYIWLGENSIEIVPFYSIVFFIVASVQIIFSLLTSLSNGLGLLKSQTYLLLFGAIINIPMAYLLVYVLDSWIGVIISNIISLLLYCVFQPFFIRKKIVQLEVENNV